MNVEEITKKLKEIRADAYDSAHSGEDKSVLQLPDDSKVPLLEDTSGEDVKLERTKGKDFPTPKTLSRTTPMDGGKRPKEDIYVNDATLKAPSIDELQNKLDDLKKNEINKKRVVLGGRQSENPNSRVATERDKYHNEQSSKDLLDEISDSVGVTYGLLINNPEFTTKWDLRGLIPMVQKIMEELDFIHEGRVGNFQSDPMYGDDTQQY